MRFLFAFLIASICLTPAYSHARGHSGFSTHSYGGSYSRPYTPRAYTPRSYGSVNPSNHYTSGYMRNNGTYVQPYHATNPNQTRNDNYSTRGNVNPYTGQAGTKDPD